MYRFFLIRRHIDPALLSAAMALLTVRLGPEIFIFGFFAGVGVYLIVGMHRSMRYVDRTYAISAGLYAAGAVLIGLMHGGLSEEIRWIGYPVFLLLGIVLFPGVILIKDPLRQVVLGARAGLVLAVVIGGFEMVAGPARIGFGGNAATAAFVLVVVGVLARIPVRDPARFLPNSRLWFYTAAIAVIMTGTRSVLPVFALSLVLDLLATRRELADGTVRLTVRSAAMVGLIGILAFTTIGHELVDPIATRLKDTVNEVEAMADEDVLNAEGLKIRLTLWEKAIDVVADNPLIGAGGARSMREVKQAIPKEERARFQHFNHVHQFVLDELRQRGVVGLFLMLGFFVATAGKLWVRGSPDEREAVTLFLASILLFGSMHGVLLADRNMALIAIFLSMLLLDLKKKAFWARVRGVSYPKTA